ncbi:MAG: NADH-ubiquinone oxidoreductase chain N [Cytophagales bacterium]|jgi:NADH-quinone oxidoreductase subunit N|nr:NADH-quinone oxidoreductase subunit N [Bacteroidota bacterium]MBS1981623.1 NADH-quinone oxidoreductase subunit N [Bacteroidota bacterium]WHZ08931.1 MAG: NADH-ubiquinone oxidoreductase chain N [Cytophagales bacterium]
MNALYIICGTGVFALLAEVFSWKKWINYVSLSGLILATILTILDWRSVSYRFHGMVYYDHVALAFTALILLASIFWFWMSRDYFKGDEHTTDKSALVFFAIAGAMMMISFNNMAMLFLGIEVLSISLYVLAGSDKTNLFSTEASFKYFLMGSFSTGFLLFGIALVYGATGSFSITTISESTSPLISSAITGTQSIPRFYFIGMLLMLVGVAFKISAAPFHLWTPDVYEGSPTPITTFMSTVVKIAAFSVLIKIFSVCFARYAHSLQLLEQGLMVVTFIVANIAAVRQKNLKRMLAFSSVSQVGYLLLAFSSDSQHSSGVLFYYLIAYSVASLLAFAVINLIEIQKGSASIDNLKGLFKNNPLMAVAMTIAMFSLAGIPPLAGFFGKYLVFTLSLSHGFVALTVLAVIASLIGVYYYFAPVVVMSRPSDETLSISKSDRYLLIILIAINLLVGLFPDLVRVI